MGPTHVVPLTQLIKTVFFLVSESSQCIMEKPEATRGSLPLWPGVSSIQTSWYMDYRTVAKSWECQSTPEGLIMEKESEQRWELKR